MEDILSMNLDYIIVAYTADHAYYNDILNGEMWQSLSAVKNGNVYEAPYGPYSWMGGPPSVQRLLSMIWLGNLFYPDVFNYNVEDNVKEFYSLFFRYDLSDSDYDQLTIYAKNDSSCKFNADSRSISRNPCRSLCCISFCYCKKTIIRMKNAGCSGLSLSFFKTCFGYTYLNHQRKE